MSSKNMSEIEISSSIMNGLSSMIGNIVRDVVRECGSVHNFDASEMIRKLNLDNLEVSVSMNKSKNKVVVVKEKVVKEKEMRIKKSVLPMPFNGLAKENCCSALRQNQGLYTQCETVVSEPGFCKKCGPSAIYGTIQERLEVGIMDFRDPKGKAPTRFTKIMKKLKISREDVEKEAGKLNIKINDIHFEEEEIEKKEKGRPKKARRQIELADDSTDLFAALVAKANEDSEEEVSDLSSDDKSSIAESIIDSVLDKVSVISENNEKKTEKLVEIQKKEAEKAEKEAAKLAKLEETKKKEAEKAEKEAAKLEEIKKKEAAKLEEIKKKETEKAEKEAAKLAEIKKKEAEKAEKEAAKQKMIELKAEMSKVAKVAKKPTKEKNESSESETDKKTSKPAEKKSSKAVEKTSSPAEKKSSNVVEEKEEADVVKRFEFEGVKYLKSKNTGIIYNLEQDVVGKWNEKTNKIDFEEAGSEEEEDEYDE
jgi:hypothetical protein